MKILNLLTIIIMLAFASISFGQISGSLHDFSGDAWNPDGEICLPCHTPHNADGTVTNAPLWNHELSVAAYTLYTSNTLDATMVQPAGLSKLCLSCHDGTIALDSFSGNTGSTMLSGATLVGTDLSNDHPISFVYNTALATSDGELKDPSVASSGLGGTIDADMLAAGVLECSSCHDPHNDVNGAFLLMSNAASALCLTCHNK